MSSFLRVRTRGQVCRVSMRLGILCSTNIRVLLAPYNLYSYMYCDLSKKRLNVTALIGSAKHVLYPNAQMRS